MEKTNGHIPAFPDLGQRHFTRERNGALIELTRLQGQKIVVNVDLIEFIESTPDTIVSTATGKKIMVQESVDIVIQRAVEYKQRCAENRVKQA